MGFFLLLLVSGIFGRLYVCECVCACVWAEVKMYIWMKLNQTFTWSLSVCLSSQSSFRGFPPSQLIMNTWFLLITCTQTLLTGCPRSPKQTVSSCTLVLFQQVLHVYLVIFCSKNLCFPFFLFPLLRLKAKYFVNRTIGPDFSQFNQNLPRAWSLEIHLFAFFLRIAITVQLSLAWRLENRPTPLKLAH